MKDINKVIPDIEHHRTNYGKHNRLIVSRNKDSITVREDIQGIKETNECDRLKQIYKIYPELKKKELIYENSEFYKTNYPENFYDCIYFMYLIEDK